MGQEGPENKDLDFRHFLDPNQESEPTPEEPQGSKKDTQTEKEKVPNKSLSLKAILFVIVFILLAGACVYALLSFPSGANYEAPAGYEIINKAGEPPRLAPLK